MNEGVSLAFYAVSKNRMKILQRDSEPTGASTLCRLENMRKNEMAKHKRMLSMLKRASTGQAEDVRNHREAICTDLS